jgi:hypothetical protein
VSLPAPCECQAEKATYKTTNAAARMSSNHIFVSFLNLCRSAEAKQYVKPVTYQSETR